MDIGISRRSQQLLKLHRQPTRRAHEVQVAGALHDLDERRWNWLQTWQSLPRSNSKPTSKQNENCYIALHFPISPRLDCTRHQYQLHMFDVQFRKAFLCLIIRNTEVPRCMHALKRSQTLIPMHQNKQNKFKVKIHGKSGVFPKNLVFI